MDKVAVIFNLSAPGAAKFENPLALSYSDLSSLADTISSKIVRPTLYDGVLVYGSSIISLFATSTNVPLTKKTPCPTDAREPIEVASSDTTVATVSPADTVVFPYVNVSSVINISPSSKLEMLLSVPDCVYFTYKVTSVYSAPSVGKKQSLTTATIPDV